MTMSPQSSCFYNSISDHNGTYPQPENRKKRRVRFAQIPVSKVFNIPPNRCVRFAPQVVTKVSEIPRYQNEELSNFFYSAEDLVLFLEEFISCPDDVSCVSTIDKTMHNEEESRNEISDSTRILISEGDDFTDVVKESSKYVYEYSSLRKKRKIGSFSTSDDIPSRKKMMSISVAIH